ncbi:glycosyltransferase family 4 protein [Massilia sp. CFBP9012]|uniref:glycosyltransferase family 4 protein n=1 Tax=Massilia sp. CFBP9012 TaxID=3096531 RepID=UPI002A6ACC41|nr:glycosyltransferase family 4 protein [Massilia sp. CFBP9012]MDY0976362.1 glycosyltransferase family 4 protein [Massilia sp. CFBP9012]
MSSAPPRVLMVGTALGGRGGIASVVEVLRADGLFEREGVTYVATHAEGRKLGSALRGLWRTGQACLGPGARPAIVHVHAGSHASFLRKSLVLLMARMGGARTVFHLHGGGFRRYAAIEAGPLLRRWIRHTLEASSRVIALSPGWAAWVRECAPRARVEVVANPVRLTPHAAREHAEAGRILFLGRLDPAKGVDELLHACAVLAARHPRLRLVLGGSGDLGWVRRRAAELGIAGRVETPGWLDAAARDAQLARAWLFCLPSHAEGLPMSVLEAMAAGVPVVATEVGGIPEALAGGERGLLVPARDAAALAGAIGRLLDDGQLHARLACAARPAIERHYSAGVVCARLAALYAQLLDERAQ